MKKDKRLLVARNMPPLTHKIENECFDIYKSEVVQWLIKQPELLNYIFDQVKKKEIVYDPETGKWQGVDYDELLPNECEKCNCKWGCWDI